MLTIVVIIGIGVNLLAELVPTNLWIWLIPLAAAAWFALIGAFFMAARRERERMNRAEEDPGEALRRRINAVNTAFAEAAKLMDDLRRDLDAQQVAREELLAQAEEQQRLLEVNQEQAEKIRQILVGETKATIRAESRKQWLFFALGALTSIPISVAVELLTP
ncbi:hypothetical protein [Planobispora rosea]|nr:hypothetical protein [Planobispora rosea]